MEKESRCIAIPCTTCIQTSQTPVLCRSSMLFTYDPIPWATPLLIGHVFTRKPLEHLNVALCCLREASHFAYLPTHSLAAFSKFL